MANTSCVLIVLLVMLTLVNLLLMGHILYRGVRSLLLGDADDVDGIGKHADIVERFSKDDTYDRVIGGRQIPLVNYKFVAAVVVLRDSSNLDTDTVICGATIVSRHWVLAAAHCTELLSEVPIGSVRISANSSTWQNGVRHRVRRVVMHERYDGFSLANDISLVGVAEPFTGVFERSVPLASSKYTYLENSDLTVIGWDSSGKSQHVRGLDLQIFPDKFCKGRYYQTDILSDGLFCAGNYKPRPSCVFDYGGPVVQRNVLVGLVSYRGDCERNRPGIFTKVARHELWFKYIEKRYNIWLGLKYA